MQVVGNSGIFLTYSGERISIHVLQITIYGFTSKHLSYHLKYMILIRLKSLRIGMSLIQDFIVPPFLWGPSVHLHAVVSLHSKLGSYAQFHSLNALFLARHYKPILPGCPEGSTSISLDLSVPIDCGSWGSS